MVCGKISKYFFALPLRRRVTERCCSARDRLQLFSGVFFLSQATVRAAWIHSRAKFMLTFSRTRSLLQECLQLSAILDRLLSTTHSGDYESFFPTSRLANRLGRFHRRLCACGSRGKRPCAKASRSCRLVATAGVPGACYSAVRHGIHALAGRSDSRGSSDCAEVCRCPWRHPRRDVHWRNSLA